MSISKQTIKLLSFAIATMCLSACSNGGYANIKVGVGGYENDGYYYTPTVEGPSQGINRYDEPISENQFIAQEASATSNVSLTSSTFAYPTIREEINAGRIYNAPRLVRVEEMLNYFSYSYENNTEDALTTHLELEKCPWNDEHYLASVVVKAKPAITENVKNNIVILIDKSGSMSGIFNLVKTSLRTLINNLGDDDIVSIVSYASGSQVEIEGKTGKDKKALLNVVDNLKASGSTWGEGGIELAYQTAYKYAIPEGNNRVVLLTDGDFNVGKVSGEELTALIKQKANDGVFLTCVGYRSYDNGTLYTLAENGNGNSYYVDGELEAKKVFEEELGKSMYVVAKDAKCQVEFSDAVSSYRLLGYETRQMSDEEFNDTRKDAGEIMSDHTTIALYELEMKEEYESDYIFKTTLRYKLPETEENIDIVNAKTSVEVANIDDYNFASYVAEYALVLGDSKFKGNASYEHLLERISSESINDKYRDDFVALVRKTQSIVKPNE